MTTLDSQQWINRTCAEYRIVMELGHGAVGTVFMAEHEETGDTVAVKIYPPGLAADRIIQHCQLLGGLSHPNLVRIFESGRIDSHVFVVMEYVQFHTFSMGSAGSGENVFTKNLSEYMKEQAGMLPEAQVRDIIGQLLDVLEYIHSVNDPVLPGLPYGGIHPNNILLEDRGSKNLTVRLSYLGSVVERSEQGEEDAYLSLEELQGKQLTEASDVFSLGALAYFLLTGSAPQEHVVPPTELRHDIPAGWDVIIKKTLAFEPDERYNSYAELRRNLDNVNSLQLKKKPEASHANFFSFLLLVIILVIITFIFRNQLKDFISGIVSPPDSIPLDTQPVVTVPGETGAVGETAVSPVNQNSVTGETAAPVAEGLIEKLAHKTGSPSAVVSIDKTFVTGKVTVVTELVETAAAAVLSTAVTRTASMLSPTGRAAYVSYTVRKGDSLWRIAVTHGMTLNELCSTNNITTNTVLRIGDTLTVRNGTTTALVPKEQEKPESETVATNIPAIKTREYMVKKNDTYFSLARVYGCTVAELQTMNNNAALQVNQVIRVPDVEVTNAPAKPVR